MCNSPSATPASVSMGGVGNVSNAGDDHEDGRGAAVAAYRPTGLLQRYRAERSQGGHPGRTGLGVPQVAVSLQRLEASCEPSARAVPEVSGEPGCAAASEASLAVDAPGGGGWTAWRRMLFSPTHSASQLRHGPAEAVPSIRMQWAAPRAAP